MKPSRSREVYGPGIGGANTNIESCAAEADCAVCGRHFAAYTGYKKWPYRLTIDDAPPQKGWTNRMVCSWSCLCRWRREHHLEDAPKPEEQEHEVLMVLQIPEENAAPEEAIQKPRGFNSLHVKAMRWEKGMTQAELAERCGMALNCVKMIEQEVKNPSRREIEAIADALGVDCGMLLADAEKRIVTASAAKLQVSGGVVENFDARKLTKLRILREFSMRRLAELCGVTYGAIYNYEKGKNRPTVPVLQKMMAALGVEFNRLIRD